jgi:nucleoside-diphosphate-sugar epimerase
MKKVLIIGGSGYVGSFLNYSLKGDFEISNLDLNWFSDESNPKDMRDLTIDYLQKFESIILLAGHSSVKMCDNNMLSSFRNNVQNFVELMAKINQNQKFIYASSSSVYGHTNNSIVSEDYNTFVPNNYYDLTKQIIDTYAQQSNLNYYGLRFGTINGWSPNMRVDIMINAMVNSALSDGHIKLYVKDIMRPILGIKDLSNAVKKIINTENSKPGIYNLQFSAQLQNLDNAPQDVFIWLKQNGTDIVGSTGKVGMPARKNPGDPFHDIKGWNYFLSMNAGDYVEIYWSTTNANVTIETYAASGTPTKPSTASVVATLSFVSALT